MPSENRFSALADRLEADSELEASLELDAVTTLRELGFEDLAPAVERERDRIGNLVDRIYRDEEFRRSVEEDPTGTLVDWGIPEVAIGHVLVLAGAPDDVVDRATADVEAHLFGRRPATIAAMGAMLGALAFAQQSNAATQPSAASLQVSPAAQAQVMPAAQAQVSPAAEAQISKPQIAKPQIAKPQISKPQIAKSQVSNAQARWQGVQPDRLQAQARLAALLRAQGIGR
jgi:hypothetical protein